MSKEVIKETYYSDQGKICKGNMSVSPAELHIICRKLNFYPLGNVYFYTHSESIFIRKDRMLRKSTYKEVTAVGLQIICEIMNGNHYNKKQRRTLSSDGK